MTSAKTRENAGRSDIRRNKPHQVALPNDLCCMENYDLLARYCQRFEPRPSTQHVMAKWPNGKQEEYRLYCFASRADADVFAAEFEGIHFDPSKDREGGASKAHGYEPMSGSRSTLRATSVTAVLSGVWALMPDCPSNTDRFRHNQESCPIRPAFWIISRYRPSIDGTFLPLWVLPCRIANSVCR